jgi:hypothetical protein
MVPPAQAVDATLNATKARVARLARTIETEVIPLLVQHHREPEAEPRCPPCPPKPKSMCSCAALVADSECACAALLEAVQARGVELGLIYTELLAPAARRLGMMWEDDTADFATVTVGLGRLQRLLRQLSPAFGSEVQHPPHGRRIVLTQPDTEQHIFGLSMVAEFFRRDGWDVLGGVAGVGIDAVSLGAARLVRHRGLLDRQRTLAALVEEDDCRGAPFLAQPVGRGAGGRALVHLEPWLGSGRRGRRHGRWPNGPTIG